MTIIKANITDISLIQELAKKSWQNAYAEILSAEQMDYMLQLMYSETEIGSQMQQKNYHYYLLQDTISKAYHGFIGFEVDFSESTTKLHRIYLVPESKGKGVGKKAILFLHDKVKECGNTKVILAVNKYNDAQKFYKAMGYEIYDEGVFDIGNGYVMDDYLMQIHL